MKVQVKVTPKIFIEAVGEKHTDVFEQAATMQEVFGAANKCGKCGCDDLRFIVRDDKEDNKYYELHCQNHKCRARLSFGQNKGAKEGTLYPRRTENKKKSIMGGKLETGDYLPDGGWLRWNKDKQVSE